MRQSIEFRAIIGLLIWIGLISGGGIYVRKSLQKSPDAVTQIAQFVGKQRHSVELNLTVPLLVKYGDPVFLADSEKYAPIGFVSHVGSEKISSQVLTYTDTVYVTFYGNAPHISADDALNYHQAPDSTVWLIQTMFPEEKQKQISKLIIDAYTQNQTEIVNALRPIVENTVRDASRIIKDDLRNAFAKREARIREIGQKYQTELIQKQLVPLIENEIWPIIQEESEPLAAEIGNEIWQQVSVFRFGWRYVYDRTPLPEKNLAEREFNRFVEQKAIPIMKAHVGDFVELQRKILKRLAENETVMDSVSSSVKTVVSDPEIQQIFTEVFREVFINNTRLQESFDNQWKSAGAQQAIDLSSRLLEPTATDIGAALFGKPKEKITPEFARALRHRILHKDDRWFTLKVSQPIDQDNQRMPFPKSISVEFADPVGEIPYAPARDRN